LSEDPSKAKAVRTGLETRPTVDFPAPDGSGEPSSQRVEGLTNPNLDRLGLKARTHLRAFKTRDAEKAVAAARYRTSRDCVVDRYDGIT
jgi:hypothetical protein